MRFMHVDVPFPAPLCWPRMRTSQLSRLMRASVPVLFAAALLLGAPVLSAQTFAVGAGGGLLNDAGSAEDLENFSTGAGFGYVEMILEPGVRIQARYTRLQLPPSATGGPDIDVDAATLSVSYLFREEWWQGGFVAGGGGYFLKPKSPGEGQTATDPRQSVYGWHGGLLSVFMVSEKVDVRLEAIGHLIRDASRRKPIVVAASVSWKF